MLLVWLYWAALSLPGFAVLSYVRPRDEPQGALGLIALAYLLTFCLLSPVSILGYCWRLPLVWLSRAIVVLVAASVGVLWLRRKEWWRFRPDIATISGFVILIILLYQAASVGGHMNHDADFHLARIRFLSDHGLSNADPFTGTGFTHIYHTNLYHALIAAGSQLTRVDVLELWFDSLPWSRLVIAGGVFLLAMRLGNHAVGAWLAAFTYLGWRITNNWTLYPNGIAPAWLLPIGLSSCIGALTTANARFHVVMLAAVSLVMAQIHGLYAGFLGLLCASAVLPVTLVRLVIGPHRVATLMRAVILGLAVSVAAPFLYVAAATHSPAQANYDYQGGSPRPRASNPNAWVKTLKRTDDNQLYLPAGTLAGGTPVLQALTLAAFSLLVWRRRRNALLLLSAVVVPTFAMLSPPLATRAAQHLGAPWMLERLLGVFDAIVAAVLGAGLGLPIGAAAIGRFAMPLLGPGAVLFAVYSVLGWNAMYTRYPGILRRMTRMSVGISVSHVDHEAGDRRVLAGLIPAGATVLTHPMAARQFAKLYDMRFIRASRNHGGVDDMVDRTNDMARLLYVHDLDRAEPLLRRYRIEYAIQSKEHPIRWLDHAGPVLAETETFKVIRLLPRAQ